MKKSVRDSRPLTNVFVIVAVFLMVISILVIYSNYKFMNSTNGMNNTKVINDNKITGNVIDTNDQLNDVSLSPVDGNRIYSGDTVTLKRYAGKFLSVNGEGTNLKEGVNANKDSIDPSNNRWEKFYIKQKGVEDGEYLYYGDHIYLVSVKTGKPLMYTSGRLWGNNWIHASGTNKEGGEGGTVFYANMIHLGTLSNNELLKCGNSIIFKEADKTGGIFSIGASYKYLNVVQSKYFPLKRIDNGHSEFIIYN